MKKLTYLDRIPHCKNSVGKKLLRLMHDKKTNLALSADVTTATALLHLAQECGPEICILKTHIDTIDDFSPALTIELKKLADKHHFLIFEDRKFADIGTTVLRQYQGGVFKIADWADMINAHSLPGPGIVSGLAEAADLTQRGLILLAEMSSKDNLIDDTYIEKTLAMAKAHSEFVFGFISQRKLSTSPEWIYLTPGIQFNQKTAAHGQQYNDPTTAICKNGSDVIIVGRGITHAEKPALTAKQYREAGFQAYLKTLTTSVMHQS